MVVLGNILESGS